MALRLKSEEIVARWAKQARIVAWSTDPGMVAQ
jgi:hypothetical protein